MQTDFTTLPLFDTRRAAHTRITPTKQKTYAEILAVAGERGAYGVIADEISDEWNCSHNHVAPRISELAKSGQLVRTRRTRLTRSGSPASVYVLPEFA
jgi:hypothetical protein